MAELGSHTSHLNPLFYAMSFGMGALAGALGFRPAVAALAPAQRANERDFAAPAMRFR